MSINDETKKRESESPKNISVIVEINATGAIDFEFDCHTMAKADEVKTTLLTILDPDKYKVFQSITEQPVMTKRSC
jgi:hypothetical protein